jgi:hypothetical protein
MSRMIGPYHTHTGSAADGSSRSQAAQSARAKPVLSSAHACDPCLACCECITIFPLGDPMIVRRPFYASESDWSSIDVDRDVCPFLVLFPFSGAIDDGPAHTRAGGQGCQRRRLECSKDSLRAQGLRRWDVWVRIESVKRSRRTDPSDMPCLL